MLKKELEQYHPLLIEEERDRLKMLELLESDDKVRTRENTEYHFTVSAWIVNQTHEKVLMAYHNIYDSYSWIGGHLDGAIDCKAKLCEEIEEETGLQEFSFLQEHIISLEILPVKEHIKKGKKVSKHHHLNLTYYVEANDSLSLQIAPEENSEVAWIKIDDLELKVHEKDMMNVYRKIINRV